MMQFDETVHLVLKDVAISIKVYSRIKRSNIDLNELSVIEVNFYKKKVRCALC
jgi:hypothetical protein